MYKLNKFWDNFFCLLTVITQGPSFLIPARYKTLHYRHHLHSDNDLDPHSPIKNPSVMAMMLRTYKEYETIDPELDSSWVVRFGDHYMTRISFILFYSALYLVFTDSLWFLLLVPIHCLMGPIHGAIVNWCGHKYGYRNFALEDNSKNTLLFDFLMMGELYQNNHHAKPSDVNFGERIMEIDLTYLAMLVLRKLKIIHYV